MVPGVGGAGGWAEELRLRETLWPRVCLWEGRPAAEAEYDDDEAVVRMRHTYDGGRGKNMGEFVALKAQDGHELSAYVARPEGSAKGAVVVLQEIFGVNSQIRGVCDAFAKEGYVGIAPALFDRFERGVELKDTGADLQRAFGEFYPKLKPEVALLDVAAAFAEVVKQGKGVAVVGFCFGGLLSWLAATRGQTLEMEPACVVGYYAGGIGGVAGEEPSCPVMLHFGENDSHIGKDQIEAVRAAHPEVEIFTYPGADHAFAGSERSAYNPEQAAIAWDRTLEFLRTHVA